VKSISQKRKTFLRALEAIKEKKRKKVSSENLITRAKENMPKAAAKYETRGKTFPPPSFVLTAVLVWGWKLDKMRVWRDNSTFFVFFFSLSVFS
jgi:hypothetical protein